LFGFLSAERIPGNWARIDGVLRRGYAVVRETTLAAPGR
jgi:hypothetical protein